MPKAALHTLIWASERSIYELHEQNNGDHPLVQGDDQQWFTWLTTHTSFSFQGQHGHLNLLKEARKSGGEGYWYAYQRQGKHTAKKYVGRSTELTMVRLEKIASMLTGEKLAKESLTTDVGVPQEQSIVIRGSSQMPEPVLAAPYEMPLLAPKLQPPRLHASLVSRERLLAQLDGALHCKLTLVAAPPGFGKTTLVSQWIADRSEHTNLPSVAWISLDAGDNDPVRFWRYIMTGCQAFQTEPGRASLALLHRTIQPPFEPFLMEVVLTTFLNELSLMPDRGILVLEDYHVITSPYIHEALTFFLTHLPATLHLLIITRGDPQLPLVRLRAGNNLCEVHAADLRFSQEEIRIFLQQTIAAMPATLPPGAIRGLERRLEGWPTGLRLLTLALQGRVSPQEIEHFLTAFAGGHRSILEYFVTEVLNSQPEPLQDFLLKTSVLSRLTGSLCAAITGKHDSEQLLVTLERAGLFLEPLDGRGEWYRYHALFAESMQQEARRRLGEHTLRTLSVAACQWYEQHDLLAEAVEAALRAQNIESVAKLIEHLIETEHFLELHEFHTLRRWLEQVPETVLKQHPQLCLSYATALMFAIMAEHTPSTTQVLLDRALQMAKQGFSVENDTAKLGEISAFYAMLADRQEKMGEAVTYARQALAWLPGEELPWRSVSLSILGNEALLSGQPEIAQQKFLEARTLYEIIGNRYFIGASIGRLAGVCLEQGKLHQAAEYLHQLLTEAREREDNSDVAHAQLGLAQLSYEWNELETAWQQAQEAYDIGEKLADEKFQMQGALLLARIQYAQGQITQAQQRLSLLLVRAQLHGSSPFYREVLAWQTWCQLSSSDLSIVQHWITTYSQSGETLSFIQQEREEILMARLLLARGELAEALSMLERLLKTAQDAGRLRRVLEIRVLMTLVHAACKQGEEARQRLRELLPLAYAENYLRLFLDEGDIIFALLRSLLSHIREKALNTYVQTILHAFVQEGVVPETSSFLEFLPLSNLLSSQELRVLHLLAVGHSNAEIAEALVVSINTIRTQVRSIYNKLNVNNRVAASEAARHLQLL